MPVPIKEIILILHERKDTYMNKTKGYVSFVLHAHLPFIHHPESETYLEEQWLFEAISETYIPLLTNFEMLVNEGDRKSVV